jgi:hypothetical protein
MKIHCLYDQLAPTNELKPHPKNSNVHSDAQIERLAKILEYQGWRYPIKVSKQTGFITSGHGRLLAAQKNNWDMVPVNFQDYESEDQERADLIADNSIASWAELDLALVNAQVGDFGPDFDLDLLGLDGFKLDVSEIGLPDLGDGKDSMIIQRTFTLSTEQNDLIDEALDLASQNENCYDAINENGPGNKLAAMAKAYAISKRS